MKKSAIIITSLLFSFYAVAQEGIEFGGFTGTSYYMGDINPSKHFYSVSPAFGGLMKYNLNEHYSVRTSVNFGRLFADDNDFDKAMQQHRGASFETGFMDLTLMMEFNFLPFETTIFRKGFSPFVAGGISYMFIAGNSGPSSSYLNLPFGVGIKYGISKKVTIGAEWLMKKTFSDEIDGIINFGQKTDPSLIHNNDWVSLAGFFITIKPFERKGDCPVYW